MARQPVPTTGSDWKEWLLKVAQRVNDILHGHLNTTGTVTLTASVASTTLTDDRISYETNIILTPTTANAAAELGAGTLYISETGRLNGSVVITHANNAQADRTFRFTLIE